MKRAAPLLVLFTGACAPTLTPPPPASVILAPDDWRSPPPGEGAIEHDWWSAFGSPRLGELVAAARANNSDVAIAVARVAEARARERIARSFLLPALDASAAGSESRAVNAFGMANESFGSQAQFRATYELDLFGGNRAGLEAARAGTAAQEAAREAVLLSVSAATASGYVTLLALDARRDILRETLAARNEALNISRDRYRAGYSSQLEVRQAEAEYNATLQQIPALETTIAQQENSLSILTGTVPAEVRRGTPFAALTTPPPPAMLPAELLRRRPDVAQAEYALAASEAQMKAARARFMPQIDLAASAGGVYSSLLDDAIGIWSLGGSVLAPIFQGGRLQGQFDQATAQRDQVAFAYRRTVLTAFREVEDRRAVLANLDRQEKALLAQRTAQADALRHAERRYRAGYSPYVEQVDAQRALLAVELALVQLRTDRLTATIALYQALGGGYRMKEQAGDVERAE